MIASIRGQVQEKGDDWAVIEAGGLGYLVQLSRYTLATLPPLGEECRLWTHFHVREDSQQLFAFSGYEEKQAFLLLLTVKGVGPRLALAILSQLQPAALKNALLTPDLAALNKLPGVGKKLAERLAVELKEKAMELDGQITAAAINPDNKESQASSQAITALQNLGFNSALSRTAVAEAQQRLGTKDVKVEDLVKMALKFV